MKNYIYQNELISKKQLRQLLAWSFTNYDSMQACSLADELKYLGFKYASKAGISISIEDLKTPFVKKWMVKKSSQSVNNAEKLCLKGKINDVERFQRIIDTWNSTSEALKSQIIYYFKNYDPLNSVYIMAFSGARGNLSQVRQLVGMRGLMSDPSGQVMNLAIRKNFREGLTITDYLISGYGARKGIVDTALKTANSGYLTRRLIDVAQDIVIREKDCGTKYSFLISVSKTEFNYEQVIGRVLNKPIFDLETNKIIVNKNTQITPLLIKKFREKNISQFYIRSPLTCGLYRSICQKCYGWDLSKENLVDIGEAVGILAGQSIGEPGTQLTMRTFHTGGVFNSFETRREIKSPSTGVVRYPKNMPAVDLRTTRGDDVLVTRSGVSFILLSESKTQGFIPVSIPTNTILFPKNGQHILKNDVIAEIINPNKQIIIEIKPILSYNSGEIYIPTVSRKDNCTSQNRVVWILAGQFYNSPFNSFLNFYPDYRLNKDSYVFRSKILNNHTGFVKFIHKKRSLSQQLIGIKTETDHLINSQLQKPKLFANEHLNGYILNIDRFQFVVKIKKYQSKYYINLAQTGRFGSLITNAFQTLTGGTLYYNSKSVFPNHKESEYITYIRPSNLKMYKPFPPKPEPDPNKNPPIPLIYTNFVEYKKFLVAKMKREKYKPFLFHKTMIWLGEEIHNITCEQNALLVEHGDFISKDFELIPGTFSKTSGFVTIFQKNNSVKTVSIKSGLVYQGKKFNRMAKKVYYPGEIILGNIHVKSVSFCEHIVGTNTDQLLVRPVEIYEVSNSASSIINNPKTSIPTLTSKLVYSYKSNQFIISNQQVNLASSLLMLKTKTNKLLGNNIKSRVIELSNDQKTNSVNFNTIEKVCLNNQVPASLKYKEIQSCFLVQENQFISNYTTLGYLEAITKKPLQIVQLKTKTQQVIKQVLLISNDDCLIVKKEEIPNKTLNDYIGPSITREDQIGKIISENDKFFILQRGRIYFFPNCPAKMGGSKSHLEYKILHCDKLQSNFVTNRNIKLNYINIAETSSENHLDMSLIKKLGAPPKEPKEELERALIPYYPLPLPKRERKNWPKFFLKKDQKLYSCLVPQFFKKLDITNNNLKVEFSNFVQPYDNENVFSKRQQLLRKRTMSRTLLLRSSGLIDNQNKECNSSKEVYQFTLIQFVEEPDSKARKSVGLRSITENYFKEDLNSLFCTNQEFVETGKTLGFVKLEKGLNSDIVQGLPRIEEVLEARKKNLILKRVAKIKQKGLLAQKTSLNPNFEFRKLGRTMVDGQKVNPHRLLRVYFNYYGLIKSVRYSKTTKSYMFYRLTDNYEGSYQSLKKVQTLMLNAVQSIYIEQGVAINDKHLEVIIKQMTTRVAITSKGNTPLSRGEVVDLYHIQYINEITNIQQKQPAYYVPVLFGITKAALNNPSFISAASFQETTRVLTKAAIEGRMDWLRGLKENIVTGQLIPAGTGFPNYRKSFKTVSFKEKININLKSKK